VHADTPNPLVQRISDELLQVLSNPESAEFVRKNGGEIMPYNPERMRSFQTSEIKRFTSAVDSLNFKKI
jgi:tripartite-type tricarboxylate transporter receptor subunit TctC